jgi:hypothetical protein
MNDNKITNSQELREEIIRLKQTSQIQKMEIKTSFRSFKSSLTPLNILISIYKELNQEQMFKSVFGLIEKVRDFFKK